MKKVSIAGVISVMILASMFGGMCTSAIWDHFAAGPDLSPEAMSAGADFLIYQHDGVSNAWDVKKSTIEYSNVDAAMVIQSAVDAQGGAGKILIQSGTYALGSPILVRDNITLQR